MLKNLQARLRQYFNWELPGVQAGFRKGCETRYQIANIRWIIEKTREFPKTCTSASLTRLEPLTVWNTTNSGKLLKRCEYQTTLPTSWETCMRVKKQELEPYMKQLTGSKLRKEYNEAIYCNPVCLTYMQSTSWEMLDWMKHKPESRFPGEINLRYADDTTLPYGRKRRGTKEPLNESERGEWRSQLLVGLTFNIQKTKIMVPGSITSWQMGKQRKQWQTLFFGAPKLLQMVTSAMKLKDACSLEGKLLST